MPIWDTDIAWLDGGSSLATCTAFCQVREYDFRKGRRPLINATILGNEGKDIRNTREMPLTRILHSKINPNHVYVVTQEGHPLLLDRRKNYQVVRKMLGSRGSVRDAALLVVQGVNERDEILRRELLVTAGCDRHLRLYDAGISFKRGQELACLYLKQRLSSLHIPAGF